MGCSTSKSEKNEALLLCKERKRFIKQAIDSRYALSAAHLSYVHSLRNIGIALRRFAEAEVLIESSLSTSATELDKTPSHSSYQSPSPSHNAEMIDHTFRDSSPASPRLSTISYMRSGGSTAVTVRMDSSNRFVEEESLNFPVPPPPPPLQEMGSSWDFFDPISSAENEYKQTFDNLMNLRQFRDEGMDQYMEEENGQWESVELENRKEIIRGPNRQGGELRGHESSKKPVVQNSSNGEIKTMMGSYSLNVNPSNGFTASEQTQVSESKRHKADCVANESTEALVGPTFSGKCGSKREEKVGTEKEICTEREDPSEFITHRAKDFLSSIKDIENRFIRASESGKEVSRMLEANKIQLNFSEGRGKSSSLLLATRNLVCCRGENVSVSHETPQHVTKVITWNRSNSSQSSSSRNPLAPASRDDVDDSGSDFIEEFCMIAGSHSSTLDRLYAWERKLYDEVKASEPIRNKYDQKCILLRHQFAKDMKPQVIDKTRAVVKDLHSQIQVAIQTVDSISKRIEKLRDEELQPQLLELMQGLIRMWKVMLECHHAQYITISLAYHMKSSTPTPHTESHHEVITQLQHEINCFSSSFSDWFEANKSYVEALNCWLQNCITQPQERSRRRMFFSPRRPLAPPIFVLCRDWLASVKALPYKELSEAIKELVSDLCHSFMQQVEERKKEKSKDVESNGDSGRKDDTRDEDKGEKVSYLSTLQSSLTRTFDRLTKFAEASLKLYEDIRQGTETARVAYMNCRTRL